MGGPGIRARSRSRRAGELSLPLSLFRAGATGQAITCVLLDMEVEHVLYS